MGGEEELESFERQCSGAGWLLLEGVLQADVACRIGVARSTGAFTSGCSQVRFERPNAFVSFDRGA